MQIIFFHFLHFHKRKTLHVSFSRVIGILTESQISLAHWVNWAELLSVSLSQGDSFLLDLWVLPCTLGSQSLSYGKALILILLDKHRIVCHHRLKQNLLSHRHKSCAFHGSQSLPPWAPWLAGPSFNVLKTEFLLSMLRIPSSPSICKQEHFRSGAIGIRTS